MQVKFKAHTVSLFRMQTASKPAISVKPRRATKLNAAWVCLRFQELAQRRSSAGAWALMFLSLTLSGTDAWRGLFRDQLSPLLVAVSRESHKHVTTYNFYSRWFD